MFTTLASSTSGDKQEFHLLVEKTISLENGGVLPELEIAFQTWGRLNASKSNVVWVCHALTGNHRVHEWWDGIFGSQKLFDPANYFIVCVNTLGSAYGTSGPQSERVPENLRGSSFPLITNRDSAAIFDLVRDYLKLPKIQVLIGASLGGQQALEWVIQQPNVFEQVVLIATNAQHSPFGIAFNEAQRLALSADPSFFTTVKDAGKNGLIAARAIGMLSYRTYIGYGLTQKETTNEKSDGFKASSYQQYQGEKLSNRFNAHAYWTLTKSMDSQNIWRNRPNNPLQNCRMPALVIGIDSDLLFPLSEQQALVNELPNAQLKVIHSDFGHDGFLVDFDQLANHIQQFLKREDEK